MLILFTDVETTGLDPKIDRVVEVGASLYCTEHRRILRSFCVLLGDDTVRMSPEISKINLITNSMLDNHAFKPKESLEVLNDAFIYQADYLCAHNAPFDRSFLEAEFLRFGMELLEKPWIDTCVDLPYPDSIKTRKLTHLASEHGFLNPFPHTALSDTLTCQRIFSMYSLEEIFKRAQSPNITIRALVDYGNREKASKRGYRWNPEQKRWLKQIKQFDLDKEQKDSDFEIEVVHAFSK